MTFKSKILGEMVKDEISRLARYQRDKNEEGDTAMYTSQEGQV